MTKPIRLITLAPGHFHAALVQRQMLPGVHPKVYVYAPLDDDLVQHLARVAETSIRNVMPATLPIVRPPQQTRAARA